MARLQDANARALWRPVRLALGGVRPRASFSDGNICVRACFETKLFRGTPSPSLASLDD